MTLVHKVKKRGCETNHTDMLLPSGMQKIIVFFGFNSEIGLTKNQFKEIGVQIGKVVYMK